MNQFDLNNQWKLYLERTSQDESKMHPIQLIETKRAFYGACGQMLILFRDDIGAIEDESKAVEIMKNIVDQVAEFWINQNKVPGNGVKVFTPGMLCEATGCTNLAKNEVIMMLAANGSHPPASSTPMMFCCNEHSDIKWNDLVTSEAFLNICQSFMSAGKQPPSLKYSYLEIRPIK